MPLQVPPAGGAEVPWPDLVAAAVNAGAPHASMASHEAPYAVWKHASMGQMRLVVRHCFRTSCSASGHRLSCIARHLLNRIASCCDRASLPGGRGVAVSQRGRWSVASTATCRGRQS